MSFNWDRAREDAEAAFPTSAPDNMSEWLDRWLRDDETRRLTPKLKDCKACNGRAFAQPPEGLDDPYSWEAGRQPEYGICKGSAKVPGCGGYLYQPASTAVTHSSRPDKIQDPVKWEKRPDELATLRKGVSTTVTVDAPKKPFDLVEFAERHAQEAVENILSGACNGY